jgi:hypothetical protein
MHKPRRIACKARETPAELRTTPGRSRALPEDLLRQASRRLEIITLIGAALWVLGPALGHLALRATNPEDPRWRQFMPLDAIALLSIGVSLALFAYLRTGERRPARVLDLALLYMVAVAFDIGVMMHLGPPPPRRRTGRR